MATRIVWPTDHVWGSVSPWRVSPTTSPSSPTSIHFVRTANHFCLLPKMHRFKASSTGVWTRFMTQLCGVFFSGQGSYCSVRCRTTVVPLLARPPQLAPFSVHEPLGPITASQPSSIPRTPLGHDVARKRPDGRGAFP